MAIDIALIQKVREMTGAGLGDVKQALEETNGDIDKALEFLRAKGAKAAAKRADRVTTEGLVYGYVHTTGKLGVMVAIGCETDFVARNDQFKELAHDIALHIAAMKPEFVSADMVTPEMLEAKKQEFIAEGASEADAQAQVQTWLSESALLSQSFIKDDTLTINQLLETKIGTIGEKIEIISFSIHTIGQ